MKVIFICHPWAGDLPPNEYNPYPKLTKDVCRYLSLHTNDIPLSTGRYFNDFLHDDVTKERNHGMKLGRQLMKKCDVVYVYDMHIISEGMKKDIKYAKKLKIPIKFKHKYPWEKSKK